MNRLAVLSFSLAAFSVACLAESLAHADPKAGDPAAAQALFYEARTLMQNNKPALACPKLEESLRLDYGIGTEFNLADCNERTGKLATAWSGFLSVASAAKAANQPQREKLARERAKALEPRLPKLTIEVAKENAPPDLEVKRDGVGVGAAAWGTTMPVDPGIHRISASASGKRTWETSVTAVEGKPLRVNIPALVAQAEPVAAIPPPAPRTTPVITQQQPFPEPIVEQNNAQRTFGYVAGGLGIAALGVAAGFGINSLQRRESAQDHCNGDVCDARGVTLRDQAITSGNVATVTSIAGGAAFLGGLLLIVTAPKNGRRESAMTFVPQVAQNGAGLSFQGSMP